MSSINGAPPKMNRNRAPPRTINRRQTARQPTTIPEDLRLAIVGDGNPASPETLLAGRVAKSLLFFPAFCRMGSLSPRQRSRGKALPK
jgi:hypothetical protein